MGARENALRLALSASGYGVAPPDSKLLLGSVYANEIIRVFEALGGKSGSSFRPSTWDMVAGDFAIELDEQLHFNRFRLVTLDSPIYRKLPEFALESYRQYCRDNESDCLKAGGFGGKWSNPSTEKMFGQSSPLKQIDGAGPSRWKQRAFYDFLKDVWQLVGNVTLVRFSVWERVSDGGRAITLGQALDGRGPLPNAYLRSRLVSARSK